MIKRALGFLFLAAVVTGPAVGMPTSTHACAGAVPEQIAFAPPLGQALILDVDTVRAGRGGHDHQFRSRYRLEFASAGRGFRLTATLVETGSGAAGKSGDAAQLLLAPLVGRPVDFLIGADSSTLVLQDGDKIWREVGNAITNKAAAAPVAEGRAVGALLSTLPPAERDAMLSADIRQMLRFAGRNWAEGGALVAKHDASDCETLIVTGSDPTAKKDGPFLVHNHWRVNRTTGLVMEQVEERWVRNDSGEAAAKAAHTRRSLTLSP